VFCVLRAVRRVLWCHQMAPPPQWSLAGALCAQLHSVFCVLRAVRRVLWCHQQAPPPQWLLSGALFAKCYSACCAACPLVSPAGPAAAVVSLADALCAQFHSVFCVLCGVSSGVTCRPRHRSGLSRWCVVRPASLCVLRAVRRVLWCHQQAPPPQWSLSLVRCAPSFTLCSACCAACPLVSPAGPATAVVSRWRVVSPASLCVLRAVRRVLWCHQQAPPP
jgi:hypothetical protein